MAKSAPVDSDRIHPFLPFPTLPAGVRIRIIPFSEFQEYGTGTKIFGPGADGIGSIILPNRSKGPGGGGGGKKKKGGKLAAPTGEWWERWGEVWRSSEVSKPV